LIFFYNVHFSLFISPTWEVIEEGKWLKYELFIILFVMNNGSWDGYTTHACTPAPQAHVRATFLFPFHFILIYLNFDRFKIWWFSDLEIRATGAINCPLAQILRLSYWIGVLCSL